MEIQGLPSALSLWASSKTRNGPFVGPLFFGRNGTFGRFWGPLAKNGFSALGPFSWFRAPFGVCKKYESVKNYDIQWIDLACMCV